MIVPAKVSLMTAEELLALPEEPGVERWLIDGQLREKRYPDIAMTYRNRRHSRLEAVISQILRNWLEQQPWPRGEVFAGDAGCILGRDPDVLVGIDVVYVSAEMASRQSQDTTMLEGVPTLAVEILSPSDTQQDIDEKLAKYLKAGVPLVWLVDPNDQTVVVYRPQTAPELFNVHAELTAEPHLPGFRVPVAKIFGD